MLKIATLVLNLITILYSYLFTFDGTEIVELLVTIVGLIILIILLFLSSIKIKKYPIPDIPSKKRIFIILPYYINRFFQKHSSEKNERERAYAILMGMVFLSRPKKSIKKAFLKYVEKVDPLLNYRDRNEIIGDLLERTSKHKQKLRSENPKMRQHEIDDIVYRRAIWTLTTTLFFVALGKLRAGLSIIK